MDAVTFNQQKSSRYAFALGRISSAMHSDFYLEALTIEESMITDRLLASLEHRQVGERDERQRLFDLIKRHQDEPDLDRSAWAGEKKVPDLFKELQEWRKERNKLIHGFGKCIPGSELERPSQLMARAKRAAEEGLVLFRMLDGWLERQKTLAVG